MPTRHVKAPAHHWSARVRPVIPCLVAVCPGNKESFCLKPEAIQIDKRGICKTGARFIKVAQPRLGAL